VVIHKPSIKKGFYGADVSGPVFKRIAQKIFTDAPMIAIVENIDIEDSAVKNDYENFYPTVQKEYTEIPDVTGMAGMDAVALLENLGVSVKTIGNGTVSSQSIQSGEPIKKGIQIILNLS
jgi:cell division protein FtsI (penicillin-binding protein 3)